MKIKIYDTPALLGQAVAGQCGAVLQKTIAGKGKARLLLATGASQFDVLKELVRLDVEWDKVEMFHLDEYLGLPATHQASFRRYLKERFTSKVNLQRAYFIDTEGDVAAKIRYLTEQVIREPLDLGLIGVGENGHIAFNDPPADFATKKAYIIVDLDDNCKRQQVREGWFATVAEAPKQAVTMSVHQIMRTGVIVSCVPYKAKAEAVKQMLTREVTNEVPATILKTHPDVTLYLDKESASLVDEELLNRFRVQ